MWNLSRRGFQRRGLSAATAAAAVFVAGCGGGDSSNGAGGFAQGVQLDAPQPAANAKSPLEIRTVNNRADLISDDDALVELVLPGRAAPPSLRVSLNGKDVSKEFAQRADGRILGLLTGLKTGSNVVTASIANGRSAELTITNAPRTGPILSGEQVVPYYCAGPTPRPASGSAPATPASGLSGEPGASCNIASEFKLYYKSTAAGCTLGLPDPVWSTGATAPSPAATACFKPYTAGAPKPADMASTTTDAGVTVDYIVRVERGTINRGIYDIVSLFDPNPANPWSPTAPQAAWNGKVYFTFGSSTGQPRRQVRPQAAWPSLDTQISRGWVVAMNSMTDSARNSNRVLMSETVMMMKEHIGDTRGPIKYTVGAGCSGGSINSNMNASIMPGLLDGVITTCTYPDSETTSLEVADCSLLVEAYRKQPMLDLWTGMGLTQQQINDRKAAINGHTDQTACHAWQNLFGSNGKAGLFYKRTVTDQVTGAITQEATETNNCELPSSAVYDPRTPESRASTEGLARCNAWNWAVNIWGKVPGSNAARDTRDNVGVQYGLKALKDGVITADEFITLNQNIGGIDRDSTPRDERTTADPEALDIAYRSGIVMSGRQVAKTAIIDLRGWDESLLAVNQPPGSGGHTGIHHIWFSYAIRDRLIAESESGDANNQLIWRFSRPNFSTPPAVMTAEALATMNSWLTNLKADESNASLEQKVRAARPEGAVDYCYLTSDTGFTTKVTNMETCDADRFLRPTLSPRQVAGGPRAENILKCQLKPLAAGDYAPVNFTAEQWSKLQQVFPGGVCDWTKPGVGQQPALSPLTFKQGPGGVELGAAPVSVRN